ncbi:MAG: hypothetical protein KDD78_06330 [Caldilineaceae bacterium]|nr:hypothetical protein [Caldilineaceae bacterium]
MMKEWTLKIVVGMMLISALGELAMSQIHIQAITKIFANEIGFYLFLFIIFGLTTAFNAYLLEKRTGLIILAISGLLAVGAGYIYLDLMQTDVAAQASLTMADVRTSWLLVVISMGIYLVGLLVVPMLAWGTIKKT